MTDRPDAPDIVEIMARGIGSHAVPEYADDALWREHWEWFLSGRSNPASVVHGSNQASWIMMAESVLRALDAAGIKLVPAEPTDAMLSAADKVPRRHLDDGPHPEDVYAAMISAVNLAGRP